ncbi:MAG: mechanosensitive ion channel [Alphaproteobacteria bacterium]|nr:mechanosensitive ion channel [Alphaproteobacteria bacterium]
MLTRIFVTLRNILVSSFTAVGRYLFMNSPKNGDASDEVDGAKKQRTLVTKLIRPEPNVTKKGMIVLLVLILLFETFGFLDPISRAIDNKTFSFALGSIYISFYVLLKSILWMILLLWLASHATDILDNQLKKMQLHPTSRTLAYKILQMAIYVVVFLIAMNILGINLTSLAFFSGALGIGIGFGMQKIAANLISGFILTFERSLVPGSLIELSDGRIGYIRHISVRYTLFEAVDGLEILIPNEELVTNKLINWTLSNTEVRTTIDIGVSYRSDMALVQKLILEAVQENKEISSLKPPAVYMKDFGDNAVIFEMVYWIADVTQHWRDVRSDILFSIWQKFADNHIEIPYPQLDLHMIKNHQDK